MASQGTSAGLSLWFEERRAEGWQADYSDLSIQGFPNRVDANLTDVALADPDTGLAWTAPFFQLLALSYKPNHVIAVWPNTQTLATPSETLSITSEKMQASVVVSPEAYLPLERSNYVATALTVRSDQGWSLQADDIRAALHKQPAGNNAYQLTYQATGVAPPNFMSNGVLPAKMSAMEFDMEVDFDRTWDMPPLRTRASRERPRRCNALLPEHPAPKPIQGVLQYRGGGLRTCKSCDASRAGLRQLPHRHQCPGSTRASHIQTPKASFCRSSPRLFWSFVAAVFKHHLWIVKRGRHARVAVFDYCSVAWLGGLLGFGVPRHQRRAVALV